MSRIQELLEKAYQGKSAIERSYSSFPLEIYGECGATEVAEIISRLDQLCEDKRNIENWDGDASDDIWKAQYNFSQLLEKLTPEYPKQVVAGLKSHEEGTRFWVAHAFTQSPNAYVVSELQDYLRGSMVEHHKEVAVAALEACQNTSAR